MKNLIRQVGKYMRKRTLSETQCTVSANRPTRAPSHKAAAFLPWASPEEASDKLLVFVLFHRATSNPPSKTQSHQAPITTPLFHLNKASSDDFSVRHKTCKHMQDEPGPRSLEIRSNRSLLS